MPSIGRQFGKGEGVPRSKEALAALGMEGKESGILDLEFGEDADEIGLSAQERLEAEKSEEIWDRERLVEWTKTIGNPMRFNASWVDNQFNFLSEGVIQYKGDFLAFPNSGCTEIPHGLEVHELVMLGSRVESIPSILQVNILNVSHTNITELPTSLTADSVDLSYTSVKCLPPDLNVKSLNLKGTQITEIPTDKGVIEEIWIGEGQYELAASARALGIRVEEK